MSESVMLRKLNGTYPPSAYPPSAYAPAEVVSSAGSCLYVRLPSGGIGVFIRESGKMTARTNSREWYEISTEAAGLAPAV